MYWLTHLPNNRKMDSAEIEPWMTQLGGENSTNQANMDFSFLLSALVKFCAHNRSARPH